MHKMTKLLITCLTPDDTEKNPNGGALLDEVTEEESAVQYKNIDLSVSPDERSCSQNKTGSRRRTLKTRINLGKNSN